MRRTKLTQLVFVSLIAIAALTVSATAQDKTYAKKEICGGIAGLKCPSDKDVCKYPAGKCNVADLSGVCVHRPENCPKVEKPVCGCDGKTYSNSCELLKAGGREDHKGACAPKTP